MIHASIYPRKSVMVDNSDSMETQISMCKEYLDRKYGTDYTVTIYDGDYGISGHSISKRKDFQRMMQDITDKKIDLVVIQRYDRIARNMRDFCNIYHDMEENGCDLASVSQQIDTTTPYGKNFMYQQALMAELEWALNSERRKDANKYAATIGKCTLSDHCIPFGYKAEKIDGIRRMVKDKDKEQAVLDLFQWYHETRNYSHTVSLLNQKYGYHYENANIRKIIKNTIYYGEYRGNPNYCEPYITKEQYDDNQREMPVIRRDVQKKSEILFSGLLLCPHCGRKMRSIGKSKAKKKYYRYYHCEFHQFGTCDFRKVKSEILLETSLIEWIDCYLTEYRSNIEQNIEVKKKKSVDVQKFKDELERLNKMFLKGRIDEEYYDTEYLRLTNIIAINEADNSSESHIDTTLQAFPQGWKDYYFSLEKYNQKLFWRDTVKAILVNDDYSIRDVIFL